LSNICLKFRENLVSKSLCCILRYSVISSIASSGIFSFPNKERIMEVYTLSGFVKVRVRRKTIRNILSRESFIAADD